MIAARVTRSPRRAATAAAYWPPADQPITANRSTPSAVEQLTGIVDPIDSGVAGTAVGQPHPGTIGRNHRDAEATEVFCARFDVETAHQSTVTVEDREAVGIAVDRVAQAPSVRKRQHVVDGRVVLEGNHPVILRSRGARPRLDPVCGRRPSRRSTTPCSRRSAGVACWTSARCWATASATVRRSGSVHSPPVNPIARSTSRSKRRTVRRCGRSSTPRSAPARPCSTNRASPEYHPDYYGAFVRDPDGNNVEAVCHLPG